MKGLRRLWRRLAHCRRGEHRDLVESCGAMLQWRCVDCDAHRALGFVFLASNKIHHHWPWERADDA